MTTEDVCDRETAISELERLCKARRLVPPTPIEFPAEVVEKAKEKGEELPPIYPITYEKVIRSIQEGAVTLEEDGTAVVAPRFSAGDVKPFRCGEPTGAMYLAQDKVQGGHHQNMAALGSLCGRPASDIAKLHPRDYETLVALLGIFLR